ncbi:hypothetical protein VNI00_011309 [Paramarasmius palmivorus]|uniref:DUF6699 domain-containing protein n=1 Tax=Paramarasmius palmivorus TaxID=297713 RepID=A0AAW0CD20_9AGAR
MQHSVIQPLFERIPTGAIKPSGWALDQANVQAEGLAGNIWDFGSYVKGSIWVEGGSIEYSEMHEAAPYWFNGAVSLAFQLGDERLISQVRNFLDWNLGNQQDDGWIGPEVLDPNSTTPRLTWPRYLVLLGLIQYAEADPTQTERIVGAMHRFVSLVHTIWKNNEQGSEDLGFQFGYQYVRWEEMVYSLQWLYDYYPQGKEDELLETMQLLRDRGFSWKNDWFTDANFPKEAVTSGFTHQTHGVNTAEGAILVISFLSNADEIWYAALKSEALAYRFTADPTDKQSTFDRIDMVYRYHGRASGTYSADEHMAGLDPSRGTELCTVVEQIFSLATVYSIFGNNSIADRVEKLAYNALPAGIAADWWSHQYDQQANQIWAKVMDPPPWGNNGPNSNVFGFEPNYPCCTVNHPQAYPKFWSHAFFKDTSDSSIIHAFLGPAVYEGDVGTVQVDTLYPFGTTLTYDVSATAPFTLKIRVPEWAKQNPEKSTIQVNDGESSSLQPDDNSFHVVEIPDGNTKLYVSLDAPVEVEQRSNGAVAINRGALNFALELSNNVTTTVGTRSGQALNDVKRLFPNAPAEYLEPTDPHTVDNTLLPTGEWRLAIDPATLTLVDNSANTTEIPFYAWESGAQPVWFTAQACQIEWGLEKNTAAAPPQSPVACAGDKVDVKLVPFAAAKLRLGAFKTTSPVLTVFSVLSGVMTIAAVLPGNILKSVYKSIAIGVMNFVRTWLTRSYTPSIIYRGTVYTAADLEHGLIRRPFRMRPVTPLIFKRPELTAEPVIRLDPDAPPINSNIPEYQSQVGEAVEKLGLESETISLHWLLRRQDVPRKQNRDDAHLFMMFDMAFQPDPHPFNSFGRSKPGARIYDMQRRKYLPEQVAQAHFEQPASSNCTLYKMHIIVGANPEWSTVVEHEKGIRCIDIFRAIYGLLQMPLTRQELDTISPSSLRYCEDARDARIKDTPGLEETGKLRGILRIDAFVNYRFFRELKQKDDVWMLDTCSPDGKPFPQSPPSPK